MGFLDKFKAYLNEEDELEKDDIYYDESIISSVDKNLQADIDEIDDIDEIAEEDLMDMEEEKEKLPKKKKKGLFGRRKKKKKAVLGTNEESEDGINSGLSSYKMKKYRENERKTVQDFCEQLIDVSFHSEEIKREYKVVTSYLTDIQRIEELPVDMANNLINLSQRIEMLDKDRETYLQSENLLSMDQYNNLASLEDEVVDTIKKLNEMEMRDSMLKNDMSHLEGEKEDLRYMREEYTNRIVRMRGIIITLLVVFLLTSAGLLIYSFATGNSVTMYALIIGAVAMLTFVISYAKYQELKADIRDGNAKLKRAISLLNKVKVKYINNTNTLDYIYEKYGVNSSKELEYQWEQYNTMIRDAKKYTHANAEFRDRCDQLVKMLTNIGLEDPFVWPKQTNAIIDRREMVEIKHSLNVRRQKLRERLETCEKIRKNASIALRAAVVASPGMDGYINDLLSPYNLSIDI